MPLALFSNETPAADKQLLAERLLLCKPLEPLEAPINRHGTGFGKPKFPEVTALTSLADLAGTDSWLMFCVLRLDTTFLSLSLEQWGSHPTYQLSAANIRAVVVVNDCAERGVKLGSDFLSSARDERIYQATLQVVEKDRKGRPDLRKRSKPS